MMEGMKNITNLYNDIDWEKVERGDVYTYIEIEMGKDFDGMDELEDFLEREREWTNDECLSCMETMAEKGVYSPTIYFALDFNGNTFEFFVDGTMFGDKLDEINEFYLKNEMYEKCARVRDLKAKLNL